MLTAALRSNEAEALDALQGLCILDTDAEAQFDAFTDAASIVCDAPIALISLVDAERQWFKASVGLDGVKETPRDLAFCAHAILGHELFEVPNALLDERFHDNPLVRGEPHIRFYAGMPLVMSNGVGVGTLCVIDRVPRTLTDTQRKVLAKLAVAVVASLEGRKASLQAEALMSENRLLYESSPAMMYSVDAQGIIVAISDMCLSKMGYTREEVIGKSGASFLTPASRERALTEVLPRLVRDGSYDGIEYQVQTKTGEILDVLVSARMVTLGAGQPVKSLSVLEDITERKKAERSLKVVLDAVPSKIARWDQSLKNTIANAAYAAWFGMTPEDMRGRDMAALMGEVDFAVNEPYVRRALAGEACRFEWRHESPDEGDIRHLLVHYVPDIVEGNVLGIYVLMQDVSELVQGRVKLASVQRQNDAILGMLHEQAIVTITDRFGVITDVNDNFCKISGYERQDVVGQDHRVVSSGMHNDAFWREMWSTLQSGNAWKREICNRAKDGALYWEDSIVAPMFNADGEVDRYISIRYDSTERHLAAQALAASHHRFDVACEAAGIGTWTFDTVSGAMEWDSRMYRLLGSLPYEPDLPVEIWHKRLHPDDREKALVHLIGTGVVQHSFDTTFRVVLPDGETRYLHAFARVVPAGAAGNETVVGACIDETDATLQERRLTAAVQAAEQAVLAKSQFLANMSHEIRTPMNAVIGMCYLLQKSALDADQRSLLNKIDAAGKSLLAIINDILDLTRIDAGEMPIEHLPFALSDVMDQLKAIVEPMAHAKRLDLRVNLPTDLPAHVVGDASRLHQVLLNLLSNAVKFTPSGRITLMAEVVNHSRASWRVRFEVQDTGIGIDEATLPKLFSPFSQADASTTRRFGGSGWGLSIVRQLCELMGGTVGASSAAQQGSCFWVELPFGEADDAPCPSPSNDSPDTSLEGIRVLAVDDSGINLEVLRRTLELEGAIVCTAMNGQEALDVLGARTDGFDVVLMDAQMPVLDGYDATRRIRQGLGLSKMPIIALSAGTLSSEHERARQAGMNAFLPKPFVPRELIASIREHVGPVQAGHPDVANRRGAMPDQLADWPVVEGIDTEVAWIRLSGQTDLFLTMLRRLLDDFADLCAGASMAEADERRMLSRLHALKGSAGTLGATALAQAAQSAESGLLSHSPEWPVSLDAVREALTTLSKAPALLPDAHDVRVVKENGSSVSDEQINELLALLDDGDMRACDLYGTLSAGLSNLLPADQCTRLERSMADLKFGDVAALLRAR